ncbi:nuclear GTPase SLIP-GC-like [Astyanax mexicanus]|uniref:Nuclear GTPase SLIP-GC-like n=2 Tax=Astyanax mexicanus TaxID=7994 RepID=A0A8T2MD45_ASTMX|nr:nuclear GTPase SLIP-GC-like [Astyanax mexicanus]
MNNKGVKRKLRDDNVSTSHWALQKQKRPTTAGVKRKFRDDNASTSHWALQKQKRPTTAEMKIRRAKDIMTKVQSDLSQYEHRYKGSSRPNKKLTEYIRDHISKLNSGTTKKTTVGVFGKTGAGKSSLINSILGENLLPSATLCACTSVIIQIEANTTDSNYTAEIEFISKEEWEDELLILHSILSDDGEERHSDMSTTANEKITALYGEEGLSMTLENLKKDVHFGSVPEFLKTKTKKLTCENASDFSDEIQCYIQHNDLNAERSYWPIVNSVTIKVPNCEDFLEHIILVDLPGTGDYNKSRDQMWRSKLRDCSIVWIVSEINRAASDKDAWEILSSSISDMAQGGECRSLCFICTKTDDISPQNYMGRSSQLRDEDIHITPEDPEYSKKKTIACILHRNKKAKDRVKKNFNQQHALKKQFSCGDDFLTVFTVSSRQFTIEDPILKPEETEIPMLREHLRKYNKNHRQKMAMHYILGADGILSLIQGSKECDAEMIAESSQLYVGLEKNLHDSHEHLHECCEKIYSSLEELLTKGERDSVEKCLEAAKEVIAPIKDSRGFHRTLTALCKNDGFLRSRTGQTDLNSSMAKHMFQHIDEAFNEFFPVQDNVTEKSLQANIDKFTLIPEELIVKYKNSAVLTHLLKFLKTEEIKVKTMLKQEIIERKKRMYTASSDFIKNTMKPCYQGAAAIGGVGSMKKKQDMLLNYIESSKSTMFQKAKREVLELTENAMRFILEKMKKELILSMGHALLIGDTLPYMDVSKEIEELKNLSTKVGE